MFWHRWESNKTWTQELQIALTRPAARSSHGTPYLNRRGIQLKPERIAMGKCCCWIRSRRSTMYASLDSTSSWNEINALKLAPRVPWYYVHPLKPALASSFDTEQLCQLKHTHGCDACRSDDLSNRRQANQIIGSVGIFSRCKMSQFQLINQLCNKTKSAVTTLSYLSCNTRTKLLHNSKLERIGHREAIIPARTATTHVNHSSLHISPWNFQFWKPYYRKASPSEMYMSDTYVLLEECKISLNCSEYYSNHEPLSPT